MKKILLIVLISFFLLFSPSKIYYSIIEKYYGVLFDFNLSDGKREILNYNKRNKIIEINQKYKFNDFYLLPEGAFLSFSLRFDEDDKRLFSYDTKKIAKEIFKVVLDKQIKSSYNQVGISISVCKDDSENHTTCDQYSYDLDMRTNELKETKSTYGVSN